MRDGDAQDHSQVVLIRVAGAIGRWEKNGSQQWIPTLVVSRGQERRPYRCGQTIFRNRA